VKSLRDVAIIGAGELGGTLAHRLARLDAAAIVRLLDDRDQVAAGKALDIMQASPIERFATRVSGAGDLMRAAGAAVIVLADRMAAGEWNGDEGFLLLKRLRQASPQSVILCAGAAQRELVERGVRELGFGRGQLFGSAPEALASAMRALVGVEINGSPQDVALMVLGIPPSQVVIPWEEAAVGGFSVTRVLDEPARRRLVARVPALWPPGPIALASAAAKAIKAVFGQSRGIVSAFVAPDDTNGRRSRAAALPVRLAAGGIVSVELPSLNTHDRVALENAMLL
jgi:malate/lactate dehydrogenase